jgi:hypothetical protein
MLRWRPAKHPAADSIALRIAGLLVRTPMSENVFLRRWRRSVPHLKASAVQAFLENKMIGGTCGSFIATTSLHLPKAHALGNEKLVSF